MEKLIQKLKEKNFQAYLAQDSNEARKIALGLIPQGTTIGMGNSLTLRETGIFDELVSGKYKVINQFEKGISREENLQRRKNSLLADVYFSSVNALTQEGALVNIDGKGNRIAAISFGPEKVILVVGKNKVVDNDEGAWQRLKKAAPALAKKLGRKTPCVETEICSDCKSPERICRFYSVIRSQMPDDKNRIHVIMVNEDLGI
ncbi:MAG: hypothetical protein JM58_10980 [Peptococcaceae bacterium BICA1-8]|nr:MAG: hypothetical protein JM58_10980 [Peptococcaceae bacterium BICA1-8]